ncbi:basic membrane lipoprotein [Janibacter sp. HTCC2649]|uniref:BMP family ABC transporter substrate-binding protein n=1 Tax=Janibacter sp. HTCC2649 TaxID=313589 RepID=UPI00006718E5|nr:BMP family ABC transporter substrate-binding protein [Janibacter sp. HTCC2649]EAP98061.1 basic membrane lipoprotein [Janibacter sp. HTCC2649]
MKAKPFLVAVPAALALVLAGCGGSTGGDSTDGASAAPKDCSSADVFCIGLVTDTGSVDDKSFNQAAWEGVKALEGSGVQTKYVETKDAKDYASNLKQFTDQKYDAIVTVGFLMTEATVTAAKANPNIKFIGVDQFQDEKATAPNVTGLIFPEANAGYAAGYLAGLMTKTNKLGVVLGAEIPPTQNYAKGYEQGSKAANPQTTVAKVYHPAGDNAFSDSPWGAGEAKKMLAQGADIIFGAGGGTGNGALNEVAKSSGAGTTLFCVGVDLDQWNTVPESHPCLITSAEKKLTDGTSDLLKQAKDGSIKGGNFLGKTGLAEYHDFDSKIPAEVKTKVETVVKGLEDGSIKVA